MYWEDFIADMCHAMFGFEKPRWHYIPEFGALLDAIGDRQNHAQANRPRLDQRVPESGLTSTEISAQSHCASSGTAQVLRYGDDTLIPLLDKGALRIG
jgi:hypothetical protein